MSEYPESDASYYVCEQFPLEGGGTLTDFAAGPFEHPDQARQARDRMRSLEPTRRVHCVETREVGP